MEWLTLLPSWFSTWSSILMLSTKEECTQSSESLDSHKFHSSWLSSLSSLISYMNLLHDNWFNIHSLILYFSILNSPNFYNLHLSLVKNKHHSLKINLKITYLILKKMSVKMKDEIVSSDFKVNLLRENIITWTIIFIGIIKFYLSGDMKKYLLKFQILWI